MSRGSAGAVVAAAPTEGSVSADAEVGVVSHGFTVCTAQSIITGCGSAGSHVAACHLGIFC